MEQNWKIKEWAVFLRQIRGFFDAQGFLEVTTPAVVPAGAFESCLDVLKVSWSAGAGELHSSPEMEMKRLLAQEGLSVYQICKCFRDDPLTEVHLREFTMLEFYRVKADYRFVINDMRALLEKFIPTVLTEELSFNELFKRHAEVDLKKHADVESLKNVVPIKVSPEDTWEDVVLKVLVERVEPAIPKEIATFVTDYPASFAALAKIGKGGTAERFEIYWQGMEICNGASELIDEKDLRERYTVESQRRSQENKRPHPEPTVLFEAARAGLPVCAGVAVGLERLFLALRAAGYRARTPNP